MQYYVDVMINFIMTHQNNVCNIKRFNKRLIELKIINKFEFLTYNHAFI